MKVLLILFQFGFLLFLFLLWLPWLGLPELCWIKVVRVDILVLFLDQRRNQRGDQKIPRKNENESTTIQNPWDAAKAVLRGKFIAIQPYLRKQGKLQINNLTLHLKQLEEEAQTKPKVSRRKEIIKIRAEINSIESKKTIETINETKSWFFDKINKIGKLILFYTNPAMPVILFLCLLPTSLLY